MSVEFQKVKSDNKDKTNDYHEHNEHHENRREEYELVALSPLRRMEKRIEDLEQSHSTFDVKEFYREMIDIIRMNQQLVDELAKANDALRIELSRLPARIEELVSDLKELLSYIKAAAAEEQGGKGTNWEMGAEGVKPLAQKLDVLIETNKKIVENNQALINVLEEMDKKLTRGPMPPPAMRRPMPPGTTSSMPPSMQKPATS